MGDDLCPSLSRGIPGEVSGSDPLLISIACSQLAGRDVETCRRKLAILGKIILSHFFGTIVVNWAAATRPAAMCSTNRNAADSRDTARASCMLPPSLDAMVCF